MKEEDKSKITIQIKNSIHKELKNIPKPFRGKFVELAIEHFSKSDLGQALLGFVQTSPTDSSKSEIVTNNDDSVKSISTDKMENIIHRKSDEKTSVSSNSDIRSIFDDFTGGL